MEGVMKKSMLLFLVLISFTVYLKSGKVFKTNSLIDMGNAGMISFTVDNNKIVYVPLANIDYIKED
jgi:hypothetical protein